MPEEAAALAPATIDASRTPDVEALRNAALAACDEWDAATVSWLEWFARGGKGSHEFPVAARNRLRAALAPATPEADRIGQDKE